MRRYLENAFITVYVAAQELPGYILISLPV
jgi:hypothetical protein